MGKIAIVDIACGFRLKGVPCSVSDGRDLAAADTADRLIRSGLAPDSIEILTTGAVPFSAGGKTLAQLKHENVANLERRVLVTIIREGVGTFSEARHICAVCKRRGVTKLIIVSSSWYFWPGQGIWKRRAREQGLEMEFLMLASLPVSRPSSLILCTQRS
ncbi:MAG: hypothetical protein Q8R08_01805 [bacterium]|nr:hypothetical protein [bacterium]